MQFQTSLLHSMKPAPPSNSLHIRSPLSLLSPFQPPPMLWVGTLGMDLHGAGSHTDALLLVFKQIWWRWLRPRESFWRMLFRERPFGYYGNERNVNVTGSSWTQSDWTHLQVIIPGLRAHFESSHKHTYTVCFDMDAHTHTTWNIHTCKYCKLNGYSSENGVLVTFHLNKPC